MLQENKIKKLLFLIENLVLLIFLIFFPIKSIASTDITFFQSTLLNDFGVAISYDQFQDLYIFENLSSHEKLLFDSSGICLYKYTVVNVTKKITLINGNLIIPQQLIFLLYKTFFIPIKNTQQYETWYEEYKKFFENKYLFEKENRIDKKEEKKDQDDNKINTENKNDQSNQDLDKEKQSTETDSSTQIQKELDTYYSYAQAKMVDFKVISFIVIDAGHGGEDPGAVNGNNYEKDLNLKAAIILKRVLSQKFPYLTIYLTRENDKKLTLENRVKIANSYLSETKTGIFISLHCNANPYSNKKSGIEVYYLDYDIVDEKIKDLVKYENREVGESILNSIINRLLNEQLIFESSKLANFCFNYLKENVKEIQASFYKGAPFYVLGYSEMPAILIEMGYITNPGDLKLLNSESYLNTLSLAIAKGIEQFIKEYTISEGFKKIQ